MNIQDKSVFISGPMTGLPLFGTEAFVKAHGICKLAGAKHIFDPALIWLDEPLKTSLDKTHADYMQQCLHELTRPNMFGDATRYDFIVQLDGWQNSSGARFEAECAEELDIPCISIHDIDVPDELKHLL